MPSGRILALSAVVASLAAAQSGSDILNSLSTNCKNAASSLLSSQFATCADVNDLVAVITAQGSIVSPLNTWATNVCKQAACPDSVKQQAASSINGNCSSDLAQGNIAAVVLSTITGNFDDVKNLVCLQSSSNSTSCLTNFLTNVQTATGTQLTVNNLEAIASVSGLEATLQKLPASDLCTDCNAAVLHQIQGTKILNASELDPVKQAAQQECGSSFGTSTPSDVKEATNSGASRTAVSIGAAALVGLAALAL